MNLTYYWQTLPSATHGREEGLEPTRYLLVKALFDFQNPLYLIDDTVILPQKAFHDANRRKSWNLP